MDFLSQLEARYSGLSKSQQKIARYMRAHTGDLLFLSLTQLAARAETSPATLVRFARAMGYMGFPHMQRAVQAQAAADAARRKEDDPPAPDSLCAAACENLARMYQTMDSAQLERVAELLMHTPNVLVIGYLDAFGTAAELYHRLHCYREGMHFSRLIIDWNDMLKLMDRDTVILAVSFAPHYQYTLACVQAAKARGCRVALITDSPLNPFCALADEMMVFNLLRRQGPGGLDLSPVSGYIQLLTGHIEAAYPHLLLDANRHGEDFVE